MNVVYLSPSNEMDTNSPITKNASSPPRLQRFETLFHIYRVERECEATLEHLKQLKLEYNLMKINAVRLKNSVSAYGGKIFSLSQIRNLFQTVSAQFSAPIPKKKS